MLRILLYTGFVFCLTLFSCGKKKVQTAATSTTQAGPKYYNTITPLPYLPAYPGSFWVYVGGANNDTSRINTSPTYIKDAYNDTVTIYNGSNGLTKFGFKADTSYVPVYGGYKMWGYSYHSSPLSAYGTILCRGTLCPLLSDTLSSWTISIVSHGGNYASVTKRDTAILINGKSYYPTLVVFETQTSVGSVSPVQLPFKRTYYTKDIGMIKEELLNYMDGSVLSERHLVYYFINK